MPELCRVLNAAWAKPGGMSLRSLQKASKARGPRGCAGVQSKPPEERCQLWFLFSLPQHGDAHPISAMVVLPFSERRGSTSKKSCHLGAQARQKFPVKTAFQQKIKLVTPDTACGGICWAWKLWTFCERNKNVGFFSQKPNRNVTFSEGQLCREDIQVCAGSRARM